MIFKFALFMMCVSKVFCCDQLIEEQLALLRQPRHPVIVNIVLTIYDDPSRSSYIGQVSEFEGNGLQSSKLWEESCTPGENNNKLVLNGTMLTVYHGEEMVTFPIHCDGSFIIGVGKNHQKVIATFQYEYNIH